MQKTRIIILAGGKGTRMKSELPKALMPLKSKPMVKYLLESVAKTGFDEKPIVVVGYGKELVMEELGQGYEYVIQEEQLGTGHAVMVAENAGKNAENIIVLSADQPYLKPDTIERLLEEHRAKDAAFTFSTAVLPDFNDWRKAFLAYGRIIRKNGKVVDKEIKDCTEEELKITEVNISCYAFKASWLWENIKKLNRKNNAQGEYQLTDLWHIVAEQNIRIADIQIDPREALGANSKEELEILEGLEVQDGAPYSNSARTSSK